MHDIILDRTRSVSMSCITCLLSCMRAALRNQVALLMGTVLKLWGPVIIIIICSDNSTIDDLEDALIIIYLSLNLTCVQDCFMGALLRGTGTRRGPLKQPTFMHNAIHTHVNKIQTSAPFYQHGLTLIPAWIGNYMPSKVWGEITYPFLNFNGCTVQV